MELEESSGLSKISCPCGWTSEGPAQDLVNSSYRSHTDVCPNTLEDDQEEDLEPTKWYDSKWYDRIFNFWSFLLVLIIVIGILKIRIWWT